jgi:Fe-S-cluster containining protein
MKYLEELNYAKENKETFKKILTKIQKDKNKKMDLVFSDLHDKTFRKIDCLSCANCCKTTSPIFRDIDIKRISKRLRQTEKQFVSENLRLDEDKDYVLKKSPCLFLESDNTCRIYEDRPLACREYPHTDRKNIYQIMDLTIVNAEICPAVSQIVKTIQLNIEKKSN